MFFFSILGICVEKTYISMRPWAQQCESNGCANLFMISAVPLSVFYLVLVIVLFKSVQCVLQVYIVVECNFHTLLPLIEYKNHQE